MKIVLVGFMGAGKTSVARRLGQLLRLPVVDTDEMIVDWAGRSVPEIFAREGEAGFRARERRVVRRIADLRNVIIAAGGGAQVDPENRANLRRGARVVHLAVSPGAVRERVDDSHRPLLAGGATGEIERLMRRRESSYALAGEEIDTTHLSVQEVAERLARGCEPAPRDTDMGQVREMTVRVDPPYQIAVGGEMLQSPAGQLSRVLTGRRVAVISDTLVWQLWGRSVRDDLRRAGYRTTAYHFWGGEGGKTLRTVEAAADRLLEDGVDRHCHVVVLGGGVPGDVGGMVAAVLLRGIPLIQMPTSLLAQVDSSVGGKVGVNHRLGKNMLGAFHQPDLVLSDVSTLRILPEDEFRSGLGEVIKHGFIAGGSYLQMLRDRREDILARDPQVLRDVVLGSCRIKESFVRGDERDRGRRMMLNFGHTLGHAMETAAGGRIPHGVAVGWGMAAAARISERMNILSRGGRRELEDMLHSYGLPSGLPDLRDAPGAGEIMRCVRYDKKRRDAGMRWILLRGAGQPEVCDNVPQEVVAESLR